MTVDRRSAPGQGGALTAERPESNKTHGSSGHVLQKEEVERIVDAVMRGHAPRPVSEETIMAAVDWAQRARVSEILLALILEGDAVFEGFEGPEPIIGLAGLT